MYVGPGRRLLKKRHVSIAALLAAALVAVGQTAARPRPAHRSTILFTTSERGNTLAGELWEVRSDGTGMKLLRSGMPVGPEGPKAVLAARRRRILCFCRGREFDSLRLDGSHLRRIGRQPKGTRYDVVALSSRGQAFWIRGDSRLLSENADGSQRRVIFHVSLRRAVIEEPIAPSPSGRRIAFIEQCLARGCGPAIRTVNVDGTEATTVFRDRPNRLIGDLQWSSDERRLTFSDGDEEIEKGEDEAAYQSDLFVVGARGSRPHAVTESTPASELNPFFSPDGKRLVYSLSPNRGFDQLFAVPVAGGAPRRLVQTRCRWPSCGFPPRVIGWVRKP